jgi:hypothetical protein
MAGGVAPIIIPPPAKTNATPVSGISRGIKYKEKIVTHNIEQRILASSSWKFRC